MLLIGPNMGSGIIIKINEMYTENDKTKVTLSFLMRV